MLPKVSYFIFLTVLFVRLGSLCAQDPIAVYLTWQKDPTSTMSIQWLTGIKDSSDQVQYRRLHDSTWFPLTGYHQRLPQRYPFFIHRTELTQLKPDTVYEFKIGKEEKVYRFKTMPFYPLHKIRFIVGGDMYQGSHESPFLMQKMNQLAAQFNPDFVLIGGDIAYSGSRLWFGSEDGNRWIDWLKTWSQTMVSSDGRLIPVLAAIGNHEVNGRFDQTPAQAAFFYTFFPNNGYYVLDFGRYLSLFVLDSGHTHSIKNQQTQWLEESLKSRLLIPHKLAIYHVPAYPSCGKFDFKQSSMIRKYWIPLFEKYGIQTVFENHCHAYKRTFRLRNHRIDPQGILYLGDGAWSVKKTREPKTPQEAWYLAKSSSSRHFLLVDFTSHSKNFRAITDKGEVMDEYILPLVK